MKRELYIVGIIITSIAILFGLMSIPAGASPASDTEISVSPSSLVFTFTEGDDIKFYQAQICSVTSGNPFIKCLELSSTSTIPTDFTVYVNSCVDATISVDPLFGAVPGNDIITVTLSNTENLAAGTYNYAADIIIEAPGALNSPLYIPVNIIVEPGDLQPPAISVEPANLVFTANVGEIPAAQTITLSNSGGGILDWHAATTSTWLSLAPACGSIGAGVNQSITVIVDNIESLAVGTYNTVIYIEDINAGLSQAVPVTLNITKAASSWQDHLERIRESLPQSEDTGNYKRYERMREILSRII